MNKGILLALSTALISGFSIFISKILVAQIDPIVFTTLKNFAVSCILSITILTPAIKQRIKQFTRNDWARLIGIGIVGGSIPFALFFTGLAMTNALSAAVIHKTLFVWIALFAIPFLHEKLHPLQMIGYVLVLWGVLWSTGLRFSGDAGEWMVVAATILWAVEQVMAKKAIKRIPGIIVAWGRMSFGVIILFAIVMAQGKMALIASVGGANLLPFLVSAILLAGYVVTYYTSLQYIPVTRASSILVLSVPVTALLELGFTDTFIPLSQWQSFGLIVAGVFLITRIVTNAHTKQNIPSH